MAVNTAFTAEPLSCCFCFKLLFKTLLEGFVGNLSLTDFFVVRNLSVHVVEILKLPKSNVCAHHNTELFKYLINVIALILDEGNLALELVHLFSAFVDQCLLVCFLFVPAPCAVAAFLEQVSDHEEHVYRHEDCHEANEAIADRIAHVWVSHEVGEEEDVVHQHHIGDFCEDFHPVCEGVFHWIEVYDEVPHDLDKHECDCQLEPREFRLEHHCKDKANASQEHQYRVNYSDPSRSLLFAVVLDTRAFKHGAMPFLKLLVFPPVDVSKEEDYDPDRKSNCDYEECDCEVVGE